MPSFHNEIIGAYHELLPSLSRVRGWSSKRKLALDARIRERCAEGKPADTIGYWRSFFEAVASRPFLCGENDRGWRADLEWLLRPENFLKVVEGRYAGGVVPNGR